MPPIFLIIGYTRLENIIMISEIAMRWQGEYSIMHQQNFVNYLLEF